MPRRKFKISRVDQSNNQTKEDPMTPTIVAVSRSATHTMSKANQTSIRLIEGLGVEGDAHAGATVKHRSRVRRDPGQANLRQVHLVAAELLEELTAAGYDLVPGRMGENVTTRGIDLLALPRGTKLRLGSEAVIEVTGLRNPCTQLDGLQAGLMAATLDRDVEGNLVRKAGMVHATARNNRERRQTVRIPGSSRVPARSLLIP
jgi:MOSC domain-containing protein YiiM